MLRISILKHSRDVHKLLSTSRENAGLLPAVTFETQFQRLSSTKKDGTTESPRIQEFRKKLRERTPIDRLEELEEGQHPYQEKEPLKPFPDNTNPKTGEVGGPRGPEPTRYGDWERKGRVSDF